MEKDPPEKNKQLNVDNTPVITALFRKYYQALLMYALSIVKELVIAEEVVQIVFCKLWNSQNQQNVNDPGIGAYLYRSVLNESLNQLRIEKRDTLLKNEYLETIVPIEEFADLASQEQLNSNLEKAIENLPDKTKEVFMLSRYESLSYKEIALRLNISLKGVEFHMAKALKQLRTELKEFF
jgi:RNA polymerase sigma-70 factor, ECF subfamily